MHLATRSQTLAAIRGYPNAAIATLREELCGSFAEFQERAFNFWLRRLANDRPKTQSRFAIATGLRRLSSEQKRRLDDGYKNPISARNSYNLRRTGRRGRID
jgi:hypothetical protein